jgi:AcrR family transcriptional regulator
MPRTTRIKDEDLLAAAREVFLEKGIRATTAEVAARAGIAEGSIFRRFPSKAALFQAAMRPTIEDLGWLDDILSTVGHGELEANLTDLGTRLLEFLRSILPVVMMSWSNPSTTGGFLPEALSGPNPPPVRVVLGLARYFAAEMDADRMRRRDPELLARIFLGSLQNYVFFEVLLRAQNLMPLPARTYVAGVVDLLWNGIAPLEVVHPPAPRTRSKPTKRS